MAVKLLFICVVLCEAIHHSSPGALKLPFTDLVATVTPRKPKPLTPEEAAQVPRVPPSSDAVLAYFKSEFPEKDLSSLVCEFSSPLVLTSTSKTLPPANFEASCPALCPSRPALPPPIALPKTFSPKCDTIVSPYDISMNVPTPYISPMIPKSRYPNPYFNSQNPFLFNKPAYIPSSFSPYVPKTGVSLPSISSLPSVSIDPRRMPTSAPLVPNYRSIYSIPSSPYSLFPSLAKYSYSLPSLSPYYSLPYPLRYNQLSLPKVATPPELINPNFKPMFSSKDKFSNNQSYRPVIPKPTPKVFPNTLKESPNLFNKESSRNLPLCYSADDPQIRSSRTIFNSDSLNSLPDVTIKPFIPFENVKPSYRPYEEVTPELPPTDMCFSDETFPNNEENTDSFAFPDLPESVFLSSKNSPSFSKPTAYVNVSPSSPSLINSFVVDLTQKILSSLKSKQITKPTRKPVRKMKCYPYISKQKEQFTKTPIPSSKAYIHTKSKTPVSYSSPILSSSDLLPPDTSSISSYSDNISSPSFSYTPITDTSSSDIQSSSPTKVSILPASIADYSSSQISPSDLPSPILPSFIDLPPMALEPPVLKLKKLSKNAKTVEKLLELVFLAELLNGDDYVDWDALDAVLAMLCLG